MNPQLLAIRIKDGVFIGNAAASKDESWLTSNKVASVVNCAGQELVNVFPTVRYLTFFWEEAGTSTLFDGAPALHRLQKFVDQALAAGECVLVHSVNGLNRASALVVAYLMTRYAWCMDSALDFLELAHPDAQINDEYVEQLRGLEAHVSPHEDRDIMHPQIDTAPFSLDNEQWCLRNTFLNSLPIDHYRSMAQKYIEDDTAAATAAPAEDAPRTTRVKFVETSAPLFSFSARPHQGSILSSKKTPLTHALDSDNPCPVGPWTFIPLEETEGYVPELPAEDSPGQQQHPPSAANGTTTTTAAAAAADSKSSPQASAKLHNTGPGVASGSAGAKPAQFSRSSEKMVAVPQGSNGSADADAYRLPSEALRLPSADDANGAPRGSPVQSVNSSTLDAVSFDKRLTGSPTDAAGGKARTRFQTHSPDTPSLSRRPLPHGVGAFRSPRRAVSAGSSSPSSAPLQASHAATPGQLPPADLEGRGDTAEPPPPADQITPAAAPVDSPAQSAQSHDPPALPVLRVERNDTMESLRGGYSAASVASPPLVAWASPHGQAARPLPVAQQYQRVSQFLMRQNSHRPTTPRTPRGSDSPGGRAVSPRPNGGGQRYNSPAHIRGGTRTAAVRRGLQDGAPGAGAPGPAMQRILTQHGVGGRVSGGKRTSSRERNGSTAPTTPRDQLAASPQNRVPGQLSSPGSADPRRRAAAARAMMEQRQPSKRLSGTFASPRAMSGTHASPRGYDRPTAATMGRIKPPQDARPANLARAGGGARPTPPPAIARRPKKL